MAGRQSPGDMEGIGHTAGQDVLWQGPDVINYWLADEALP